MPFLSSIKYVIENDNGFENTVAKFTKIQYKEMMILSTII